MPNPIIPPHPAKQQRIADEIGVDQKSVCNWLGNLERDAKIPNPPASRQDFDVWRFQHADKGDGGHKKAPPPGAG